MSKTNLEYTSLHQCMSNALYGSNLNGTTINAFK